MANLAFPGLLGGILALIGLGRVVQPPSPDPAPPQAPAPARTNEPAGYVELWTETFAHPGMSRQGQKYRKSYDHTAEDGASHTSDGNPNLLQITPKGSMPAPFGDHVPGSLPDPLAEARQGSEDGYVAAVQIPQGWKEGVKGSGAPGIWASQLGGPANVYARLRFKLSSNYIHFIGSKIGYFRADGERGNMPIFFSLNAMGTYTTQLAAMNRPIRLNVGLQGVIPPTSGPSKGQVTWNAVPNLGTPQQWMVTRGVWQTIEIQLVGNSPGQPDGILRLWLNGVKIVEYNNCGFFGGGNAPNAHGWKAFQWTPTHDSFDKDGFDFSVYQVMDEIYASAPR